MKRQSWWYHSRFKDKRRQQVSSNQGSDWSLCVSRVLARSRQENRAENSGCRGFRDEKVPNSLLDVKPRPGATDEAKRTTPEMVLEGEIVMSAPEQKVALARLQARRKQIERELARLEREIVRASSQVLAVQERITSLTPSNRRVA